VTSGLVEGEGEDAADVALLAQLVRRRGLIEGERGIDVEPNPAVADGRAELGEASFVGCDISVRDAPRGDGLDRHPRAERRRGGSCAVACATSAAADPRRPTHGR
jgi:hypothetical protein